ncbi:hypothetical protein PENVUL_c005G00068 [Penicillium vulpinum]|uniref:Uncharacterized protein n=1 Tax=Penicillium vulpinum TaxID=29845 RepID=A0A1V6S7B4_9EURO|nr:hypothetical protein PENVUL_c005G00068 [Penicillium vulpinum]
MKVNGLERHPTVDICAKLENNLTPDVRLVSDGGLFSLDGVPSISGDIKMLVFICIFSNPRMIPSISACYIAENIPAFIATFEIRKKICVLSSRSEWLVCSEPSLPRILTHICLHLRTVHPLAAISTSYRLYGKGSMARIYRQGEKFLTEQGSKDLYGQMTLPFDHGRDELQLRYQIESLA